MVISQQDGCICINCQGAILGICGDLELFNYCDPKHLLNSMNFERKIWSFMWNLSCYHLYHFFSILARAYWRCLNFEPLTMLLLLTWAVFAVTTKCWTNDEKIWILCSSNIFNIWVYIHLYPYFISRRPARTVSEVSDKWKSTYIS